MPTLLRLAQSYPFVASRLSQLRSNRHLPERIGHIKWLVRGYLCALHDQGVISPDELFIATNQLIELCCFEEPCS